MTKVAVISDTHWGVRNDNVAFMDMTKSFLDNVFFPYLKKHKIEHVIHLGDLVDRRKQISYYTANRLRNDFLNRLADLHIQCHLIVGNHDCYYKNTNQVNALAELVDGIYPSMTVHVNCEQSVSIGGHEVLLVPWICADNREQTLKTIQESKAAVCMGHLELEGFEMFRGSVSTHGDNRKIFEKFDLTLSGHYHHRSSDGSICYVGSHGQFTWSDYDDSRGFHVLDLDTRNLTFVENPYKMFTKAFYNDDDKDLQELLKYDFQSHKGSLMKLVVIQKNNPFWFDKYCEQLEKAGLISFQIVDDHQNLVLEQDSEILSEAESTLSIFKKHIEQSVSSHVNKDKLEQVITDLYTRAMTLG